MIYYLATLKHRYTMMEFLAGPGRPLARQIRVVSYRELRQMRQLPFGIWIFSDVDRLSGSQSSDVYPYWKALTDAGMTVLNHPIHSMRRYDLLRRLHEDGINDFDAYMMNEHRRPKRFPVFVRKAYDHGGAHSPLLPDQAALDAERARLDEAGIWCGDRIIVEFIETADAEGIRRKYAAFRVGDRLIPRQVFHSKEWVIKKNDLHSPELAAEEAAYLKANPHGDQLMKIFQLAGVEYGRIDYSFANGRLQVFEIYTNPTIIGRSSMARLNDPDQPRNPTYREVLKTLIEALAALDPGRDGPPATVKPVGS